MVNETIIRIMLLFLVISTGAYYTISNYFTYLEDLAIIQAVLAITIGVFGLGLLLALVSKRGWRFSTFFNLISVMMTGLFFADHYYLHLNSYVIDLTIILFLAAGLVFSLADSKKKQRIKRFSSIDSMKEQAKKNLAKNDRKRIDSAKNAVNEAMAKEAEKRRKAMEARNKATAKKEDIKQDRALVKYPTAFASVKAAHTLPAPRVPQKVVQNHIHDNVVNFNPSRKSILVGSKGGRRVHQPNCMIAKRIPAEKRIIYHDKESAVKDGFSGCSVCIPFNS